MSFSDSRYLSKPLLSSKTYDFRFKEASLLEVKVSRKSGGKRYFEGIIRNNTNKKIKKVEFTVVFKGENSPYRVVGRMTFSNLRPKESSSFQGERVLVNDIDGRDFKVKLTEVIMEE
jgi:hypothetical protein